MIHLISTVVSFAFIVLFSFQGIKRNKHWIRREDLSFAFILIMLDISPWFLKKEGYFIWPYNIHSICMFQSRSPRKLLMGSNIFSCYNINCTLPGRQHVSLTQANLFFITVVLLPLSISRLIRLDSCLVLRDSSSLTKLWAVITPRNFNYLLWGSPRFLSLSEFGFLLLHSELKAFQVLYLEWSSYWNNKNASCNIKKSFSMPTWPGTKLRNRVKNWTESKNTRR